MLSLQGVYNLYIILPSLCHGLHYIAMLWRNIKQHYFTRWHLFATVAHTTPFNS